jgi:glucose-6-phosphate isomerase
MSKFLAAFNRRQARRTKAEALAAQVSKLAQDRAVTKYHCSEKDKFCFTAGYLTSMIAQLASVSPATLKELEAFLAYAEAE